MERLCRYQDAPGTDGAWRRESKRRDKGSGHKTLISGAAPFGVQEKETQAFSSSTLQQYVYWVCLKKKITKIEKRKPKRCMDCPIACSTCLPEVRNQNYFGHWGCWYNHSRARRLYVLGAWGEVTQDPNETRESGTGGCDAAAQTPASAF